MLKTWSRKFYGPKCLAKQIISVFEQNGPRIKQFRKHKKNKVDVALLKRFKQERSDIVRVNDPLLMITYVVHKL